MKIRHCKGEEAMENRLAATDQEVFNGSVFPAMDWPPARIVRFKIIPG